MKKYKFPYSFISGERSIIFEIRKGNSNSFSMRSKIFPVVIFLFSRFWESVKVKKNVHIYRVSQSVEYKLKNIVRSHNLTGKYEQKRHYKKTLRLQHRMYSKTPWYTAKEYNVWPKKSTTGRVRNCHHWLACTHDAKATWLGEKFWRYLAFNWSQQKRWRLMQPRLNLQACRTQCSTEIIPVINPNNQTCTVLGANLILHIKMRSFDGYFGWSVFL